MLLGALNNEKITWDYVKVFLNSGCVFFDIGCQKGIFSEGVLNLLKENCSVYGFDVLEHPEILDLQEKFSNFKFINSAVGNGEDIECMIHYDTDTFVENEKSISLDDFCIQNQIDKVDFIKIDVDGGNVYTVNNHGQTVLTDWSAISSTGFNQDFKGTIAAIS